MHWPTFIRLKNQTSLRHIKAHFCLHEIPWWTLLSLLGIAGILPFLLNAPFIYPAADDYVFAVNAREMGFWKAQWVWYHVWQGRYTASMLLFTSPLVYDALSLYKWLPFLWMSGLICAIYLLLKAMGFIDFAGSRRTMTLTLLLLFIYLHRFPSTTWGLFWMAGAINYQLGNILTLLGYASLLFAWKSTNTKRKAGWGIISGLFLFLSAGCNETFMVFHVCLLGALTAYHMLVRKTADRLIIALWLVSITAALIVVLAPGNGLRTGTAPEAMQFWPAVFASLKRSVSHIALRLFISPLLVLTVISLPFLYKAAGSFIRSRHSIFQIHPLIPLALIVVMPAILFFPLHYAQGPHDDYPDRITNIIFLLFIIGWFIFIQTWLVWYRNKHPESKELTVPQVVLALLLIVYSAFPFREHNQIRVAYADLISGKSWRYHMHMKDVIKKYQDDRVDDLAIRNMEDPPLTIVYPWIEISTDSSHWINVFTAKYYGRKSIRSVPVSKP